MQTAKLLVVWRYGNGNPFGDQIGKKFPVRVETCSVYPFLIFFFLLASQENNP